MPNRSTQNSTPKKPTKRGEQRSAEILAVARKIILERGFEKTAVSDIATEIGIAEGLIYRYFATKRELLVAVLKELYEPLIKDVCARYAEIIGFRGRLRYFVWRHLRVYVEEPNWARLVLHEVRNGPEYFSSGLHQLNAQYTGYLFKALKDACDSGEIPSDTDIEMVRALVYGGLEHLMWPVMFGNRQIDLEKVTNDFTQLVLSGILRTPSSPMENGDQRLTKMEARLASIEALLQRSHTK